MGNRRLHRQIACMRQSFFDEGILGEQFVEVENISVNDPPFVERVVNTYFRQASECIGVIEDALKAPCYNGIAMERAIYNLKGGSASIGALKVCKEMDDAIDSSREGDMNGVELAVQRVKHQLTILRTKLQPYFQMKRQAGPSETAVRPHSS